MTADTEALIAAVRAGDIEAAQALLPVDPIVKRAREICARHFGSASKFLSGEMDPFPSMGAVMEALRTPEVDAAALTRMARAACYVAYQSPDYLSAHSSTRPNVERMRDALNTALAGNPPVVSAISA